MSQEEDEKSQNMKTTEMPNFSREEFIYQAKVAEQTERFDDMIKFVSKFSEQGDNVLSPDERYVFATAYKNAVRQHILFTLIWIYIAFYLKSKKKCKKNVGFIF